VSHLGTTHTLGCAQPSPTIKDHITSQEQAVDSRAISKGQATALTLATALLLT